MCGWRFLALLTAIALCGAAAVYWDSALQPEVMSQQSLQQMEFRTDGGGDRAAAERRLLAWGQHLPAEIAGGAAAVALLLLTWSVARGARRAPVPAAHSPITGEQP